MHFKGCSFKGRFRIFGCIALLSLFYSQVAAESAPVLEDIFVLQDLAIEQMKVAWNLSNIELGQDAALSISEFWRKFKLTLQKIHYEVKSYDHQIINNRPSSLMNKVLDLQDLTTLQTLSNSDSKNPFILWRVKWIELSSMATKIHLLYNKRVRDMMNDEPYIKTVAVSIQKYMGHPWYSKLSGNYDSDDTLRYLMKHFPDWIESRTESVPEGDLYYGLRKLLDASPTAKGVSSVESGDCKGNQTIARIVPSSLAAPIYVLFYLALVDIKYFILINFYYIYMWVYESSPFTHHESLEKEMRERLARKVELYKEAFKDYETNTSNMPTPVIPGYFRCDPPQADPNEATRSHRYNHTYIKITNFLKAFVAPETAFSASKTCRGTCDMIDGTRAPCNASDTDCIAEFEEDCVKDPEGCKNFQPPCPIEDTICIDSGKEASYCKSKKADRLLEWAKLDDKTLGEYHKGSCSEPVVNLQGGWEMENEPVADTPSMCEMCMCHCYSPIGEDLSSVRSFSLKPALSSFTNNKVVVGIKFQQIEDQIHLMVAEAKALPNQQVDISTLAWRKPRVANASANPPQLVTLKRSLRIFHLDDIVAPPGHVVTGARFITSMYEGVYLHEYVGIHVQVHQIDEATGQIIHKTATWIGNQNATISREPYNYVDPDDPVKADGAALPDSSSNQFITFRATSVNKDLAQSTVPYFDAQRVLLDETSTGWLRGIGVFHKSRPRYGGFLGLKLIKYNDP